MGQAPAASNTQHVTRNLGQLRAGILQLERDQQQAEAAGLLRNQFDRMRDMLGGEKTRVEQLPPAVDNTSNQQPSSFSTPQAAPQKDSVFVPYSDEPPPSPEMEPSGIVQHQLLLMDEQDEHLEHLSRSIGRQRDISIQINDELEVHTGLLEELDHDLDNTGDRMSGARRRLEKFSRGVKGNWSTYTIALLILLLLILIIIFKT